MAAIKVSKADLAWIRRHLYPGIAESIAAAKDNGEIKVSDLAIVLDYLAQMNPDRTDVAAMKIKIKRKIRAGGENDTKSKAGGL